MTSYLIGILAIVGMMVMWVLVQGWWRNTFAEDLTDEDVLAGRSDCGACGCKTLCKTKLKRLTTE